MIKKRVNAYVTPQFYEEFKEVAQKHQLSMSMAVNIAMQYFVLTLETGEPVKLDISMMLREYPTPSDKQIQKFVDEEAKTKK